MFSSNQIKYFSFKKADEQLLKNQIIDENSPGSILRDFNCLLNYINSHTIEATKTNYQFSLKHLVPINERLTHPIKLKLNRPLQKSFPNINGLYLILRSIGIVNFDYSHNKPVFTLDKSVLKLWNDLNPTERYFTLLEAWLIRGEPKEMLGEQNPIFGSLLNTCYDFWRRIPVKGLTIEGNRDIEDYIKYLQGFYNIALLELFGFLEIHHGEPEIGKGWRILRVKRLDFGNAMFKYIFKQEKESKYFWKYEYNYDIPLGQWQLPFQSFFPEWQNNLVFPETEFRDGIFIFKVSLGNIWRSIEIHSEMTLEDLTDIILDAFEFDKDHLYAYYYKNRFGNTVEIKSPNFQEEPYTTEKRIGDIPIQIGSSMKFLYDFGDNWEFEVFLDKINPVDRKSKLPKIIDRHGDPPLQYPDWEEDEW